MSLITGIKNLFIWLPIIWKDRQYDYRYLLIILERKLSLMEKFFKSENTYSKDAKDISKEIKGVKEAIHRLIKDDYINIPDSALYEDVEKLNHYLEIEEEMISDDLIAAFNTIRDKIRRWWD